MAIPLPKASHLKAALEPKPAPNDFDTLAPGEQTAEVRRTLGYLKAAQAAEVNLSAQALAKIQGYEQRSRLGTGMQKVKQIIPRVIQNVMPVVDLTSDKQRIGKAVDVMHQWAIYEDRERTQQAELRTWFAGLNPQQRKLLTLTPLSSGDPELSGWELGVLGTDEKFSLGHVTELPANVLRHLTAAEKKGVEQRRKFWASFELHQGAAIEAFIEEHFEKYAIGTDKNPIEIDWLMARRPEAGKFFEELAFYGNDVTLLKCHKTPEPVGDSIRHIAVHSQHKFVTTWLPGFLRGETEPQILERDVAAVEAAHEMTLGWAEKIDDISTFRHALLNEYYSEQQEYKLDFAASIERIRTFKDKVLQLQAQGELTKSRSEDLEQLNQTLREGLGHEYARRRLLQDDANRTSEGAQAIIKLLALVAPAADVLQNVAHLGSPAKVVAAMADDVLGGQASLEALRGGGFTSEELKKAKYTMLVGGVFAAVIASQVERAQEKFSPRIAGAMFSASAVLLSAVTTLVSVKYFADNYKILAEEGKLPGQIHTDPQVFERLRQLEGSPSGDEVIAAIDEALQAAGLRGVEHELVMDQVKRNTESKEYQELLKATKSPAAWKRYAAGLKEACGINPAQLGLTFGTWTAPAFGALFGPLFLANPLAFAAAGSYETMCGAAAIYAYNWTAKPRWRHHVKQSMKANVEAGPRPGRAIA